MNAALAMIEAAAPRDEIEGARAVQMACTHTAAMAVLARLGGGASERRVAALESLSAARKSGGFQGRKKAAVRRTCCLPSTKIHPHDFTKIKTMFAEPIRVWLRRALPIRA